MISSRESDLAIQVWTKSTHSMEKKQMTWTCILYPLRSYVRDSKSLVETNAPFSVVGESLLRIVSSTGFDQCKLSASPYEEDFASR